MPRFTCAAEPGGTWTVWDNEKEAPATLGGKSLTGMNKFRAETACDVLEHIDIAEHKDTGR
jgi:hypothetical protein